MSKLHDNPYRPDYDNGAPEADDAIAPMDTFTACMICEGVEMAGTTRQLQAWQYLIDTGTVWSLQGWYGRTAKALIEAGHCREAS